MKKYRLEVALLIVVLGAAIICGLLASWFDLWLKDIL